METIATLTSRYTKPGTVQWIGVRPARKVPLLAIEAVMLRKTGLEGDHRKRAGKRTVTLIQDEHLAVIASLIGSDEAPIEAARLRRNIAVSGISLLALRNQTFRIGEAVLRGTGLCAPCSRMEAELGNGGYNAMRGHGGICAEVLEEGEIRLGDEVQPWLDYAQPE
ncbi:MAG: MOSC domain-containing protein [Pseudomonadota bacterium]